METNVNILNEISVKLGGESGASSVVEALNNIANALGDTDPDVIRTVNDSLNDILEYAGGGGGGAELKPVIEVTVVNNSSVTIYVEGIALEGNNLVYKPDLAVIQPNNTGKATALTIKDLMGDGNFVQAPNFNFSSDSAQMGPISDMVNLAFDNDQQYLYIVDPSSDGSCTVEFTDTISDD